MIDKRTIELYKKYLSSDTDYKVLLDSNNEVDIKKVRFYREKEFDSLLDKRDQLISKLKLYSDLNKFRYQEISVLDQLLSNLLVICEDDDEHILPSNMEEFMSFDNMRDQLILEDAEKSDNPKDTKSNVSDLEVWQNYKHFRIYDTEFELNKSQARIFQYVVENFGDQRIFTGSEVIEELNIKGYESLQPVFKENSEAFKVLFELVSKRKGTYRLMMPIELKD